MLFREPELVERDRAVIARIEKARSNLGYALTTPRRWTGLLRRVAFARAIRGSNSIEGYVVTEDDAIAAVAGEEPIEAKADAWAAVTGYQQAMTYVLQLANDPHFSYSADLLRGLHFMMLQHDLSRSPGRWRPGPIFVRDEEKREVVYEAPDAEQVPRLIEELASELNSTGRASNGMVQAAMGHLNLVMVHPFSDGNGRMARCLQTLILARTGVLRAEFSSIEEYLGRNTRAYYDVLAAVGGKRWSPQNDALPWVRFCLTAHYRQAKTLLRRAREMQRLWDGLEALVAEKELPERTIFALADAANGLRVRNATYRTAAEISDQVASRDLKLLVRAKLLRADGERRGRSYRASEALQAIAKTTREAKPVADPYEVSEAEESYSAPRA